MSRGHSRPELVYADELPIRYKGPMVRSVCSVICYKFYYAFYIQYVYIKMCHRVYDLCKS